MLDVLIVGAGVMGAATAYALARAGRSVTVLDRFELGHTRGSSHGKSRVFRFSYREPSYVQMAIESSRLWRELEEDAGTQILHLTGGFDLGAGIDANAAALEAAGVPGEMTTGADVMARWPGLSVPAVAPVLFSPDSGWTNAGLAVAAFARLAADRGARFVHHQQVHEISPDHDGVVVRTADGSWEARCVVVTAGAWARDLLFQLDIELPVVPIRQTALFFRQPEALPPLVEWGDPVFYALPDPDHGLKAAQHVLVASPDDPDEDPGPDPETAERVTTWVRERFPAASPDPVATDTCFYTVTEDESFVIERHGRVVVGSPCSGHGFKFAPLSGRRIAALAEEVL